VAESHKLGVITINLDNVMRESDSPRPCAYR
jgi:hypothetical protein